MTALPFVILAVVLSLGTQPPPKKAEPAAPAPPVVEILIVVGTQDDLAKTCSGAGVTVSSVLVATTNKQVYHCVGNKLFNHADHGKEPALEKAVVRLNAGQAVRWVSKTRFMVVSVEKHEVPGSPAAPKKTIAPDTPFVEPFPKEYRNVVLSSPVRDEPGTVVQRYKASFNIEGVGVIDPDLICSM